MAASKSLLHSSTAGELAVSEEERIRGVYAARRGVDERYSWFNDAHLLLVQERERVLLRLLKKRGWPGLQGKRILEIGCGNGFWLNEFVKWGSHPEHVSGIDLLESRLADARRRVPREVNLSLCSAGRLPFESGSFDLVLQSTLFTSILETEVREQIAREMLRVVRFDGLVLWYDYHRNNPRNPDVRGVKRREIEKLFRSCRIELVPVTLAPPLARLIAPHSHFTCHLLAMIPLLCTHYMGVIEKPGAACKEKS